VNFITTPVITTKPYDYKEPELIEQNRQNG
jgi:hypothetical protein